MAEIELSRVGAVKHFLELNSSRPVGTTEMMTFWKVCSTEEKTEFAEYAARVLGVTLKAV